MARSSPVLSRRFFSLFKLRPEELQPVIWSGGSLFFLFASYYVLRPIRDDVAVASGIENLPWLFTGTLTATLLFHPLFTAIVGRFTRERFIAITYRFFALNLLLFFILFRAAEGSASIWIGRFFFVWTNVFNLFVVSVFWAGMVDTFETGESKRVFGIIALGGTLGAVLGSGMTTALASRIGQPQLLLLSILLLEAAVFTMKGLQRTGKPVHQESLLRTERSIASKATSSEDPLVELDDAGGQPETSESLIGGSIWAGLRNVVANRFLIGIAAFIFLYTLTASFLYFQQAEIIGTHYTDRETRTSVFASIDLAANLLTIAGQLFLTARVLGWLAIGGTLAVLPAVCMAGFSILGTVPSVGFLIVFQVIRRAGDYVLTRPARETLFTTLEREDKYKSKNFIDTFVYRVGDQTGAWGYAGLMTLGMTLQRISWLAVGLSALWFGIALWLGREKEQRGQLD